MVTKATEFIFRAKNFFSCFVPVHDILYKDRSNSVNSGNPKGIINRALDWLMVEDKNESKEIVKLTK